jgi:hypothetical protein
VVSTICKEKVVSRLEIGQERVEVMATLDEDSLLFTVVVCFDSNKCGKPLPVRGVRKEYIPMRSQPVKSMLAISLLLTPSSYRVRGWTSLNRFTISSNPSKRRPRFLSSCSRYVK